MKVGPRGIALIKHFEGCPLNAYKCPAGIWTIGFGDTGPHVAKGLCWTQDQADAALVKRLETEFAPGVEKAVGGAATTAGQFGAMVSLAYNIGVGAFAKSSVAKFHIAGDAAKAQESFAAWNKAGGKVLGGLVKRRSAEAALYGGDLAGFDKAIGYAA